MAYDLPSFKRFARKLTLDTGKTLALEPFQLEILADHFGPAIELVTVIPKKNYKTTTLGALAIFHLHEVSQADIPVLAASTKQAGIMFRQAEKLIRNSGAKVEGSGSRGRDRRDVYELDGIEYEIRAGLKEIRANGGVMYVVANDESTLDGVIPTLGLIDELHRHRTGGNYGLISDGLGPRKGRMVTISTAGASEDSPLGKLRANAHTYRNQKVDGRHIRYAQGATVLHEWALIEGTDDPENLRDVKRANPAKAQTLTELRRRRADPMMTVGRWFRFACGIWTVGEEPSITGADWDRLRVDIGQIEDGEQVILAPSVGHNAAIAIVANREDRVACKVEVLEADLSASMLVKTENAILELCERYDVVAVHHPMAGFIRSVDILADQGVPMVEAPHSVPRLAAASGTFNRALRSGLLMHDGDPTLRAHVLSATLKTNEAGERYEITDRSRGLIALVMAVHAATALEPEPFVGVPSEGIA